MPTTACMGSLSDKQCQTRRLGVIPRESLLHGYPFRPRLIADRVVTWYHMEFRSSDRHLCAKSYRILYVSWCGNTDWGISQFTRERFWHILNSCNAEANPANARHQLARCHRRLFLSCVATQFVCKLSNSSRWPGQGAFNKQCALARQ